MVVNIGYAMMMRAESRRVFLTSAVSPLHHRVQKEICLFFYNAIDRVYILRV